MRINTNVSSLVAQEASVNTSKNLSVSLEKLSSGLRINKASDDASGLAIADKLRTQATSINQGIANGNSAITLLQIADKSMSEQSSILDTIKAKLIQANTNTTSADGRESIRKDVKKLLEQLDNIAEQTNYNGNVLLQKSATDKAGSTDLSFQVGETNRDIITNTSIQSNTFGLGSKDDYASGATISSAQTLKLASNGVITLKGTDSSGANSIENVTLKGNVDELTLTNGMSISNVNAATKAVLDTMTTTGGALSVSASGTYTVTSAGIGTKLNLSSVSDVEATVSNALTSSTITSAAVTSGTITSGQVATTSATTGTLYDTLNDSSKFEKVGSTYRAKGDQHVDLAVGDVINVYDLKNLPTAGTGSYNAGDTIKATSVTTGSYLDNELNDTTKFTKQSTGVYVAKTSYTAGDLNIGAGESITITQGIPVTSDVLTTGLVESNMAVSGTNVYRLATGSANFGTTTGGTASGGTQLAAANGNDLTFTVTATAASGAVTGTNISFNIHAGDVITFTDAPVGTSGSDQLSKDILSNANFINIATGKYQALASGSVSMDAGDVVNVTRKLISTEADITISGNAITSTTGKAAVTGAGNNDAKIEFKTTSGVTATNNNTATGSSLTISGDGTNAVNDNEKQLNSLSSLNAGELTADIASSFQSVVDDAITKLNGYRGDIGSTQNQVESAVRNLMTQATNVKAAESIIRDVDYAAESANFNKQNIISQAGSYAISQSNAVQQNVLRLLQ